MKEHVIAEMYSGFVGSDGTKLDKISMGIFSALEYEFKKLSSDRFKIDKNYAVKVQVVELTENGLDNEVNYG